jgi:hypothetical protein
MSKWFKTYIFHWSIIESHSCKLYKWFWKYKSKEALKFIYIKSICLLRGWWKQNTRLIILNNGRPWIESKRKHQIALNKIQQQIPKTTRGDRAEKLGSKSSLDFSKRGLTTSSYTSLYGFSTKTSPPIDWQAWMQFPTKQSSKIVF